MRNTAWILAGALALPLAAPAADGDPAAPPQPEWARWQGRLSLGPGAAPGTLGTDAPAGAHLNSPRLMGDFYFGSWSSGPALLGGLRATSGVMFGSRAAAGGSRPALVGGGGFGMASRPFGLTPATSGGDPYSETTTQPYVGVGYTGLSVRSGFSFSADLGLLARGNASAARTGLSSQGLDDAVRQMRMTPLVQLGASYSF